MLITNDTDSTRKNPSGFGEITLQSSLSGRGGGGGGGSGEALPRGPTPCLYVYQFDRRGCPLVYPTTKLVVIKNHQIDD